MFLGIAGTYRKNDSVDVVYESGGRRTVATGLPIVPQTLARGPPLGAVPRRWLIGPGDPGAHVSQSSTPRTRAMSRYISQPVQKPVAAASEGEGRDEQPSAQPTVESPSTCATEAPP